MQEQFNVNKEKNIVPDSVSKKIEDFYNDLFKKKIEEGSMYEDDEYDLKKIEEQKEGEKKFYFNVVDSFNKAIHENEDKQIVVLFDLDETLVHVEFGEDNSRNTVVRPSACDLMNFINGKGGSCGFISNRSNIHEQLEKELNIFKSYIKKSEIYSSRGTSWTREIEESIGKRFTEELRYSINNGDLEKIIFLDKLILENNDKVFVIVDDMIYPQIFKYGIALKNNEKFYN